MQYIFDHLAVFVIFGYFLPLAVVFSSTAESYFTRREEDDFSRLNGEETFLTPADHFMFYATGLLPGANLICALLILGLTLSDAVFEWVWDQAVCAQLRRQERDRELAALDLTSHRQGQYDLEEDWRSRL